jgi:hypothetical protein
VGNWSLDSRWTSALPNTVPSSWINVGLYGKVFLDFNAVGSDLGKVYAQNVQFMDDLTVNEKLAAPSDNSITLQSCELWSEGVKFVGCPAFLYNCIHVLAGTISILQATGTGVHNTFESKGGSLGYFTIVAGDEASPPLFCKFGHSTQADSSWLIQGSFSTIQADDSSIPLQTLIVAGGGGSTLDQIKRTNQPYFADVTGARPATPYIGQQYYDTTLGLPIWWNGASWKNAAGAIV